MLRVLSLSTLFPNPARGANFGIFVKRQADAVAARGDIDLTVVSPVPQARGPLRWLRRAPDASFPALGIGHSYRVLHPAFAWLPGLGAFRNPGLIAKAVLSRARELHAAQPFDLIDAQFFYPDGPAAATVAAALGLPLSIKARGSDIHYWGARAIPRRWMVAAADRATGLLAVSAALKADMAALGMAQDRIAVHYTGLDHAVFHRRDRGAARAALAGFDQPVPPEGRLIACVGNLIPLKGQALVLEALAELPDVRLLLAGAGPDRQSLRDRAGALGVSGRVHFGSYPPAELATALAAADAVVLPSAHEGLANVWVEALACGTPLVITDVGGAREVVTDPAAGRLVERSPEAIAAAVRELLASPLDPAAVAAHAARFTWERNAAELAAHWERVAGR